MTVLKSERLYLKDEMDILCYSCSLVSSIFVWPVLVDDSSPNVSGGIRKLHRGI